MYKIRLQSIQLTIEKKIKLKNSGIPWKSNVFLLEYSKFNSDRLLGLWMNHFFFF